MTRKPTRVILQPEVLNLSFLRGALLVVFLGVVEMRGQLYFDTITGLGVGGSGNWVAKNWNSDSTGPNGSTLGNWPTSPTTQTAVFAGTAGTVTVNSAASVGNIDFNVTGYTVNGTSTLTLSSPSSVTVASGTATISAPLAGGSLTKAGAGTLTVSGTTSYTGGTTVSAGTLNLSGTNNFSGGTTVSGGTLNFSGTVPTSGNFSVSSGILALSGTGFAANTTNLTLSGGTLSLASAGTFNFGTITISGSTTIDFGGGVATLSSTSLIIQGTPTITVSNFAAGSDAWTATSISPTPNPTTGALTNVNWSSGTSGYTQAYWGNGAFSTTPIPEPSTYGALMAAGCAGLIGWRRRRSRREAAAKA